MLHTVIKNNDFITESRLVNLLLFIYNSIFIYNTVFQFVKCKYDYKKK